MADFQFPNILTAVQDIAKSRFSYHSGLTNLKLEECPVKNRVVVGFWMGIILVSGKDIRITFKTNFSQNLVKKIISKNFNKNIDEITTDQTKDFIREYCNLVAGSIKTLFETLDNKVGISLPLVLRGFDNLFFNEKITENNLSDTWRLADGTNYVDCSCYIEVLSPTVFKDVEIKFVEKQEEEVDFL